MTVQSLLKEGAEPSGSGESISVESHREQQIQAFLPFIKYQVLRLVGRIPHHVDVQDLTHAGILGLLDAVEKYDPSRGTQLKTYAEFRIRGAILDELRSMDWASRATRDKLKRLESAQTALERVLQRPPTEEEMAESLNMSMDEYHRMVMEARGGGVVSIEEILNGDLAGGSGELVADSDPHRSCTLRQIRSKILEALAELSERERMVLHLYYYEELTMKEIGLVLQVTESRVCQIHSQALSKLKDRLRPVI